MWLTEVLHNWMHETLLQAMLLVAPVALLVVILHVISHHAHSAMARRYGWRGILWTGWLGTPIHELSHALVCKIFGHRIVDMKLYAPDPQTGRLGYVRHSWNPGSYWQRLGTFFIALAPLIAGTLILYLLFVLVAPGSQQIDWGRNAVSARRVVNQASGTLQTMLDSGLLTTLRGWLFLYLVLCVGLHMAPSWADYRGAGPGAVFVGVAVLVFNLLYAVFGGQPGGTVLRFSGVIAGLMSLLVIALVMTLLASLIIVVAVHLPRLRSRKTARPRQQVKRR